VLAWQRTIWTKGAFSPAAERPEYDTMLNSLLVEFNAKQRVTLQHEMDQTLYEQYHRVMLGT
jgi:hypothetical protein